MNPSHALIIDDEPDIRELLELTLSKMGIETTSATDLGAARQLLTRHKFDLCFTDMQLPDGDGLDLVRYINSELPELPVAVITAHGSMSTAVEALKNGAFDFVSKPVQLARLRQLVEQALRLRRIDGDAALAAHNALVGNSPVMRKLQTQIDKLARSQAPVHLFGESGSGKEMVARCLHAKSPRREAPFVPVNCGAIPEGLVESEFFGHKKGSFTGATQDKEGLFQAANGGTLLLDEVAELPMAIQVKLLRVIQEMQVRQIGSQQETPVDVRILSATNKNLGQLVEAGDFREDLYYRINVISVHVPALRQRTEDIEMLSRHFLERQALPGGAQFKISADALEKLRSYTFPGNVRELQNILERACALCDDDCIRAEDLSFNPAVSADDASQLPAHRVDDSNLGDYLEGHERLKIIEALEATNWNKTEAAKRLGISFRALRYRVKKLGLQDKLADTD